ncbi:hypothetical protein [Marinobacter changyiensis]|uniref:hypothetical protein n=1 Tax=Marinobacter changyiensis TaxID=2604091 RepID=UPI0015D45F1B|nr:hypothetical protein [Marinobacter changyiensis]
MSAEERAVLKRAVEAGERSGESDLCVNDIADAVKQKHREKGGTEDNDQAD